MLRKDPEVHVLEDNGSVGISRQIMAYNLRWFKTHNIEIELFSPFLNTQILVRFDSFEIEPMHVFQASSYTPTSRVTTTYPSSSRAFYLHALPLLYFFTYLGRLFPQTDT